MKLTSISKILLSLTILMSYNSFALESCKVPQAPSLFSYKKKDKQKEQDLCSIEFFNPYFEFEKKQSFYQVGLCPKSYSTNPATELYLIPTDIQKSYFESFDCRKHRKKIPGTKIAKFKSSLTCSYTPSILAYYHFSRYFKTGDTPVAVYKEIPTDKHYEIVQFALDDHPEIDGTIRKTWKQFEAIHEKGPDAYRGERIFSNNGQSIYGALSFNPRGENRYYRMSGRFKSYSKRYEAFVKTRAYRDLTTASFMQSLTPGSLDDVQKALEINELGNLLIMDYLLSQKDRVGNIHYKLKWAYINAQGNLKFKKNDKYDDQTNDYMKSVGAKVVRKLLMKDNDCGVNKTNHFKDKGITARIAQLSRKTYKKVFKLYETINSPSQRLALETFMKTELKFTNNDFDKFESNVNDLTNLLHKKCINNKLSLDADVNDFIKAKTVAKDCLSHRL